MYYVCWYDRIEKLWKAYFTFGEYQDLREALNFALDHSRNSDNFIGVVWGNNWQDLDKDPENIFLTGKKWTRNYK